MASVTMSSEEVIRLYPGLACFVNDDTRDKRVMNLENYKKRFPFKLVKEYTVPSKSPQEKVKYHHVPESHRYFLKIPIDLFCYLQTVGLSVRSFELSTTVFSGRAMKFRGLQFVKHDNKEARLQLLHDFINKLFIKYSDYGIPELVHDLLTTITDYRDAEDAEHKTIESILSHHFAILSDADSLALIRSFHSKVHTLNRGEYQTYLSAVGNMEIRREYKEGWTKSFTGFRPELGPIGDCFNYMNDGDCFNYMNDGDQITYSDTNRDMIRFWKNNEGHLPKHMRKYKYSCSNEDKNYCILAFFGKELSSLWKELIKKDIGHRFYIRGEGYKQPVSAGWEGEGGLSGSGESGRQAITRNPEGQNPNRGRRGRS